MVKSIILFNAIFNEKSMAISAVADNIADSDVICLMKSDELLKIDYLHDGWKGYQQTYIGFHLSVFAAKIYCKKTDLW